MLGGIKRGVIKVTAILCIWYTLSIKYSLNVLLSYLICSSIVSFARSALTDALATSAKEYIIRFILKEVFGANASFSTFASQLFADWNPLDLLKIFKNKEECDKAFPSLSDRLITMLVRYYSSQAVGGDSNNYALDFKGIGSTYLGNLFGEVVKDSDISEKVAKMFCDKIH